jgi:vancomycin resistance protein YoaR
MFNKQKLANIFSNKNGLVTRLRPVSKPAAVVFFLLALPVLLLNLAFVNKIYPGTYVAGVYVGGLSIQEAHNKLADLDSIDKLKLIRGGQEFEIPVDTISYKPDAAESVNAAYNLHRSSNLIVNTRGTIDSVFNNTNLPLIYSIDEGELSQHLNVIETHIATEPKNPSARVVDGKVVIEKGSAGSKIDMPVLNSRIDNHLSYSDVSAIEIPVVVIDPTLSEDETIAAKKRLEAVKDKQLNLVHDDYRETYRGNDLMEFFDIKGNYHSGILENEAAAVSDEINTEPVNPVFVFEDNKVKQFTPPSDGLTVDREQLIKLSVEGLKSLEERDIDNFEVTIPVKESPPDYGIEDINNLGIRELIGKGTSQFTGSIASRIHNISLASSHFNGVLVKPNETFSFNEILGDVSEYTGYKQAYIIKDGKTILGDGGGVCQVSTTLFRATLDAGLEIVERRAHSYRVGYYEQDSPPGFDATVYAPTTDLKVKNDTPGHILIQTRVDLAKRGLAFEIYGTNDGRSVTIGKPKVYDVVPPPEDMYVDDPALPEGEIKQIDWKAWGAKVVFDYLVEKGGNIIHEETFYSNYKPWQSVFLRGTGPAIQ